MPRRQHQPQAAKPGKVRQKRAREGLGQKYFGPCARLPDADREEQVRHVVLGDLRSTDTTCDNTTTLRDLDDGDLQGLGPFTTANGHCTVPDPATNSIVENKPPVVPIVNLLLGFRINLGEKMNINIEGGFRDVFFAGTGVTFVF